MDFSLLFLISNFRPSGRKLSLSVVFLEMTTLYGIPIKSASANLAPAETPSLSSNRGSTPKIKILWPSAASLSKWQAEPPKDLNETSIVMRIDYGLVCAYLTGDIPKEILEGIVDKPCQILKVAHHGSKTGTSDQVLDKIKPQIAVIQLGKNNRFGHPHKEVVDSLNSKGVKILRNDMLGTIEVETDGKSLSIKGQK